MTKYLSVHQSISAKQKFQIPGFTHTCITKSLKVFLMDMGVFMVQRLVSGTDYLTIS